MLRTAARRGLGAKKHVDSDDYRQWETTQVRALLTGAGLEPLLVARANWLPSLLADLRAMGRPQPVGDVGLVVEPAVPVGWKARLLEGYWRLEGGLLLGGIRSPGVGHSIVAIGRK